MAFSINILKISLNTINILYILFIFYPSFTFIRYEDTYCGGDCKNKYI